ncbi:hypothetical protein MRX96_017237 [Rhipicephalus microplus]
MTDKNMDIGTPSISAIEKPRESTLSAPVRDDCLDRLLQANEERKRKVDQLAIELSALKVDHRRNASRERCQSRERSPRIHSMKEDEHQVFESQDGVGAHLSEEKLPDRLRFRSGTVLKLYFVSVERRNLRFKN